ncbi:MAG: MBL fold metallo-hydrolase [Lachnospiraceae bacterium]|nr:MBL fold metallo-hydrolase [Lachnospiraceae bacterium]
MKITMLGTGHALVTECYNTCFVLSEQEKHLLVDGGGGNTILWQLKRAGIHWAEIREIFVTHKHVDHLMGIIWMVRMICHSMNHDAYEGEARIYAHEEVIELIRYISSQLLQEKEIRFLDDRLHLITVTDKETRNLMGKPVTFFDIQSSKAKQYGFTMEIEKGEKLTCCGDEPYKECEKNYVENSKWLLHEAFCLHEQADRFRPYEKAHSTVKDACQVAERLKVENLLLYHTEDDNIKRRKELYHAEGEQYFHGNLYIPEDLEVLEL